MTITLLIRYGDFLPMTSVNHTLYVSSSLSTSTSNSGNLRDKHPTEIMANIVRIERISSLPHHNLDPSLVSIIFLIYPNSKSQYFLPTNSELKVAHF